MPPVLQKWSVRVPLGPPTVAPRLPQGPPRATPSPQGLPQEPSGELCPPQRVPPDPPRSTSEQTRGASEINGFTTIKPTFPPRGGAGPMRGKAFGRYWGLFFSSAARFVWFLDRWGRRGSYSPVRRPSWPRTCPPKVPQRPVQGPKCTILCSKTNDFAKPSGCQKCPLRTPLGPPRLPQGPPRAPQGRPRAPKGVPQEPRGEPKHPPRVPQGHPKEPKIPLGRPWSHQREPPGAQEHPRAPKGTSDNPINPQKGFSRCPSGRQATAHD